MPDDPESDYWDDPARDTVHGPKSYRHREPVRRISEADLAAFENACEMADWRHDLERGEDPELYEAIRRKRRE